MEISVTIIIHKVLTLMYKANIWPYQNLSSENLFSTNQNENSYFFIIHIFVLLKLSLICKLGKSSKTLWVFVLHLLLWGGNFWNTSLLSAPKYFSLIYIRRLFYNSSYTLPWLYLFSSLSRVGSGLLQCN